MENRLGFSNVSPLDREHSADNFITLACVNNVMLCGLYNSLSQAV